MPRALPRSNVERVNRQVEDSDSLDDLPEEEWNRLWGEEAERRYDEFLAGRVKAYPVGSGNSFNDSAASTTSTTN